MVSTPIQTIKFSQFASGGDLSPNQSTAGLLSGADVLFNNPFPLLPPGNTAARPTPAASMYYRLRFNTDLQEYEYYSPIIPGWVQLEDSVSGGIVNPGVLNQLTYYAATGNAVSGLATTNSAVLITDNTGVLTWLHLTDGQLVIGSTAGFPGASTLTAGAGISVTNASNSITIASTSSGVVWHGVAGTTQAAVVQGGYVIQNAALTTVTLPATAPLGSVVAVRGLGASGWVLQANTGQVIHIGNAVTSATGSLASTNRYDTVDVTCIVADTTWTVSDAVSSGLTIV